MTDRRSAQNGHAACPTHGAYAQALRSMGALLVEHVDGPEGADPPDGERGRILPMIGGLLQGRQALRDRDRPRAVSEFSGGLFHLALIAYSQGDPHLRILDFLRAQRQRYDDFRGHHRPSWWDRPPPYHFDRLIGNVFTLTQVIDAARPDRQRLRNQAADAANYAIFFLQTSRVVLPPPPSLPELETHSP